MFCCVFVGYDVVMFWDICCCVVYFWGFVMGDWFRVFLRSLIIVFWGYLVFVLFCLIGIIFCWLLVFNLLLYLWDGIWFVFLVLDIKGWISIVLWFVY